MTEPHNHVMFEQVVKRIDPTLKLLRAWELEGGISAQVTALEIQLPDRQTRRLVVRQHGGRDRRRNPNIAADEFKLLEALQSVGVPAPRPLTLDVSLAVLPTPYLVVEYVEGRTEFTSQNTVKFARQIASTLAQIHSVDWSSVDLSFLPAQDQWFAEKLQAPPPTLDDSVDEGRIRDELAAAWPLTQHNHSVLLHGDFWPGNLLWHEDKLVAVIDWEDAAVGDPLADLANCRLELLWACGIDAMSEFTLHYRAALPALDYTNLPYWDLCTDLRLAPRIGEFGLDEATERVTRERRSYFVAQAFEKLQNQRA